MPYISSLLNPDAKTLLAITRKHWAIENSMFCRRDLFYNEDRSTVRSRHGPYNLALFKSLAISLSYMCGFQSLPLAVQKFKLSAPAVLNYFKIPRGLDAI